MLQNNYLKMIPVAVGLLLGTSFNGQAQTIIGMGTDNPNPNAVLELVPENANQGFLAPRLTSAQRNASSFTTRLTNADNGLLVFDTEEGQFFYWYRGEWQRGVSNGQGGSQPINPGTTWYTGTTEPRGINAVQGDFYINESTGEVYKFSGSSFAVIGSLGESTGSNRTQNLADVLQRNNSAANLKITDLGEPTDASDAATKEYVDQVVESPPTQTLSNILGIGNDANGNKIIGLANPAQDQDAATKFYVDQQLPLIGDSDDQTLDEVLEEDNDAGDQRITGLADPADAQDAATKQYVDTQIGTITPSITDTDDQTLSEVLTLGNDANNQQITNLSDPTADQHAATKKYVDGKNRVSDLTFNDANNRLTLTEDGINHEVDLSDLQDGGTPATLPEGAIYLGDNAQQPQPVTISGDVKLGESGNTTVEGIQGRAISANNPLDEQVLQWNGTEWTPTTLSSGTWYSGPNNPSSENPSGAETNDFYLRTGTREVFLKNGDTWNSVGYLSATPDGGGGGSVEDGKRQGGLMNVERPVGDDRKVGTLWLDQGARRFGVIKMWNGSNWVEILRGEYLSD